MTEKTLIIYNLVIEGQLGYENTLFCYIFPSCFVFGGGGASHCSSIAVWFNWSLLLPLNTSNVKRNVPHELFLMTLATRLCPAVL